MLEGLIYDMIRARRAEGVDHGDLLSMLVLGEGEHAGMSEAEQRMSDKQARDELLTLFLAGHETTALAVTYAFYLLSHNPKVEAKLVAELNGLLGEPGSTDARLPGWEDLPKLEYARRVFSEAILENHLPGWKVNC